MSVRIDEAMLFDAADFYGADEVLVMTDREVAVYMLLVSVQWRDGELPADPRLLALRASSGERRVSVADLIGCGGEATLEAPLEGSLWESLKGCFDEEDGKLYNPRCKRERADWLAKKEAWAEAGTRGGAASSKARRAKSKARKAKRSKDTKPPFNDVEATLQRSLNDSRTIPNSLSLSLSSSSSQEEEKTGNPPLPPAGGDSLPPGGEVTCSRCGAAPGKTCQTATGKPANRHSARIREEGGEPQGLTVPVNVIATELWIPHGVRVPKEFREIGIDSRAIVDRIRRCKAGPKKASTWNDELDRVVAGAREFGAEVAARAFRQSSEGGWVGCTWENLREMHAKIEREHARNAVDFHKPGPDLRPLPSGEVHLKTAIPFDDWEALWLPAIRESYGDDEEEVPLAATLRAQTSDEGGFLVLGSENETLAALLREALDQGPDGEGWEVVS